jgi:putative membrane protein
LVRRSPLRPGAWLFTLALALTLAISALYELGEWAAAMVFAEGASAFLGTQGDVWDTQWDMFLALLGAASALVLLSRIHDRQLSGMMTSPEGRPAAHRGTASA